MQSALRKTAAAQLFAHVAFLPESMYRSAARRENVAEANSPMQCNQCDVNYRVLNR